MVTTESYTNKTKPEYRLNMLSRLWPELRRDQQATTMTDIMDTVAALLNFVKVVALSTYPTRNRKHRRVVEM